jgi:hypothetical protein
MEPRVKTHRIVSNNKLDFIIRDNKPGTCMPIDGAVSADRHVIKREAEKILEYKDITIEIQRMWNMKGKVNPIITRET